MRRKTGARRALAFLLALVVLCSAAGSAFADMDYLNRAHRLTAAGGDWTVIPMASNLYPI